MSISSESHKFENPPYPQAVRVAWTEILIACWKEGDNDYIDALRSNPLDKLDGNSIIDRSDGKYFPLPDKPPEGVPSPDSDEHEAELRKILQEPYRHFGQMMMGGGWPEGEEWINIIIRAWKDPDFLQRLRNNPREALETDYPEIGESLGKFFPISKDRPKDLQGFSEDDLREKLNDGDSVYMGWMMTCCR